MPYRKKSPGAAKNTTNAKEKRGKIPAGKPVRVGAKGKKKIPEIALTNWKQFADVIRRELGEREFIVRNFDLVVFDGIETGNPVEVDLLAVARSTGNDRRKNATMWNAEGFDHDHDRVPSGKNLMKSSMPSGSTSVAVRTKRTVATIRSQ